MFRYRAKTSTCDMALVLNRRTCVPHRCRWYKKEARIPLGIQAEQTESHFCLWNLCFLKCILVG